MRIPSMPTKSAPVVAPVDVIVIGGKSYSKADALALIPTEATIDSLISAIAASSGNGFKLRRNIDDALTDMAVAQAKVLSGALKVTETGIESAVKAQLGKPNGFGGEVTVPLYRNGRQVTDADCVTVNGALRPHRADTTSTRSDDGLWFTTAAIKGDPTTDLFDHTNPWQVDGFRVWKALPEQLRSLSDAEFEFIVPALNTALAVLKSDFGFQRYTIAQVRGGDWAVVEASIGEGGAGISLGYEFGRPCTEQDSIDRRLYAMYLPYARRVAQLRDAFDAAGYYADAAPSAE